ncbi:MAG TPA: formate dehydrogenase accessory sulfurtransferase FdhD [Microlunatus sp.]|nr:formate dehydrogenase accessory sulfurtransferase FdhD [Microlunatus sp.]
MGRVTRRQRVVRIRNAAEVSATDTLAVEEPLEIRLGGRPFQVTMRTPGEDIDLVHGLLHSEQVIGEAGEVLLVRYCAGTGPDGANTYNVVDVTLRDDVTLPEDGLQRNVLTSSACGVCGTASIDQLMKTARHALSDTAVTSDVLLAAPRSVRAQQKVFAKTGGLHAAALLTLDGAVLCVREDVGRHNAVDKVVGWALRQGRVPLTDTMLFVSGRASFELTQKAVLAGVGILAAVSAPSSLAVELAEASGVTLVGFLRDDSMNVYSHPSRVRVGAPDLSGAAAVT